MHGEQASVVPQPRQGPGNPQSAIPIRNGPTGFALVFAGGFASNRAVLPDWLCVVILGVIEGVTEFLPVSSTGHLLMAQHWLGHRTSLFNVGIQSGAVLAVLVIFTDRLKQLVFRWREPASRDYGLKLVAAFVLTGVGGLALKKLGFELPEQTAPIAIATLVGGILFLVVERWLRGRPVTDQITWVAALWVGASQLLAAVFPGASRSGTTVLMALALGVERRAAVEFTFLLGIPTLLSAGALEFVSAVRAPGGAMEDWGMFALGFVVSAVTAFAAVQWLLRYVQHHTFELFGWYRIVVGVAILILVR